jgi:hypothetical protein
LLTAVRNILYLESSAKGTNCCIFHGSTEHFYIVDGYIGGCNNKERKYCCIFMATLNTFVWLTAACAPSTIKKESIVAFSWQQ